MGKVAGDVSACRAATGTARSPSHALSLCHGVFGKDSFLTIIMFSSFFAMLVTFFPQQQLAYFIFIQSLIFINAGRGERAIAIFPALQCLIFK